jgi:hypothetical protein
MKKWLAIGLIGLLLMLGVTGSVNADMTTRSNVYIDADDYDYELFLLADKDDKLEFELISSDQPVDVYVLDGADYNFLDPDIADAKIKKEGVTTTTFEYKFPTDGSYYLIIENNNNVSATVTYKFTDFTAEFIEDVEEAAFFVGMMCLLVIIIIVVVIIIIIVVIIKLGKKKRAQQQQAPPPPGYGQQPPPPPPPPNY